MEDQPVLAPNTGPGDKTSIQTTAPIVPQVDRTDYAHEYIPRLDRAFAGSSATARIINRNESLMVSDFSGKRSVSIQNILTVDMENYGRRGAQRLPDPTDAEVQSQTFGLGKTFAWNVSFDVIDHADTMGMVAAQKFVKEQTRLRLIPSYDAEIFAANKAFAVANSYETTVDSTDSLYQVGILGAAQELEERTEEDASVGGWYLYLTPQGRNILLNDTKFVRDNFKSQSNQIYKGLIGEVDNYHAMAAPKRRFDSDNYLGMLIKNTVTVHVRKIKMMRLLTTLENMVGTRSQFLSYHDTFITRFSGVAIQMIKKGTGF